MMKNKVMRDLQQQDKVFEIRMKSFQEDVYGEQKTLRMRVDESVEKVETSLRWVQEKLEQIEPSSQVIKKCMKSLHQSEKEMLSIIRDNKEEQEAAMI